MDPNQYLALAHVAMRDQHPGEPMDLYCHFACVDDRRRRRRHHRQRFISALRRERSGPQLVPTRVRVAR